MEPAGAFRRKAHLPRVVLGKDMSGLIAPDDRARKLAPRHGRRGSHWPVTYFWSITQGGCTARGRRRSRDRSLLSSTAWGRRPRAGKPGSRRCVGVIASAASSRRLGSVCVRLPTAWGCAESRTSRAAPQRRASLSSPHRFTSVALNRHRSRLDQAMPSHGSTARKAI